MSNKFLLKCANCGEEVELVEYHSRGNIDGKLISIDIEIDDDDPEDIDVNFNCEKCGNYFYISY
ncbi:hypothetical protein [Bacillus litorisediminis]|uniref:hypothetical protein n=1 Tax=Bacillus litorisediminis TaxID=2922713 RepID=UPI001FAFC6B9|nr:hypothetical protein [Bacillus litorisediminis]